MLRRSTARRRPIRWQHSLHSGHIFPWGRLSAAPFTTSTRGASSFYAFIYVPFIIFKVGLFLARLRPTVIYFLPSSASRRPCVVVSQLLFYFYASYYEVSFFMILFYFYCNVLACSRYFICAARSARFFL